MDISSYEHIIAIAKFGSIAKASEALFVSRSTLSRQLNLAEDELGIKIFDRISNKLVLTHPGRVFLEMAVNITEDEKEGRKQLEDITKGYSGRIRVGMPRSRSDVIMPQILPQFHAAFPNVCIDCTFRDSAQHCKDLGSGVIDIAIVSMVAASPEFCVDVLTQDEYVLMVHKDHPRAHLAGFDSNGNRLGFDLRWFKNDYFGFESPGSSARKISEEVFLSNGIEPRIFIDNCRYSLLINLAAAGVCNIISLDTFLKCRWPNSEDLVAFSLTPPRFNTFVAARRSNYAYSRPERTFVDLIKDYYASNNQCYRQAQCYRDCGTAADGQWDHDGPNRSLPC